MLDIQEKSQHLHNLKARILYRLVNEYEEFFICIVKFWSRSNLYQLLSGSRVSFYTAMANVLFYH